MHGKRLGDGLVHADPGGVTLLTGDNVALAPAFLDAALRRLAGPSRRGAPGDVPLLAFSHRRDGIALAAAVVASGRDGGPLLRDVEAGGRPEGLEGLGRDLAALFLHPGRFERAPSVEAVRGPRPGEAFCRGLEQGGIAIVPRAALAVG